MKNAPIVKEFLELVAVDVESFKEREIADLLTAKFEALGMSVYEDKAGEKLGGNAGNLYATLPGELPGALLLCAHMDRVPKGLGIKPRFDGELIVSDGTTILAADDLSGVAAILDGIRRIKAAGKPHCTVEVLITVCEEKGVAGSRHIEYERIASKIAFCLDSPGRIGRIINAAPGGAELRCEVFGKAAHAGNAPEQGVNATLIAAKILSGLRDGRLDFESTANYSIFTTHSTATNVVSDYACFVGETRSRDKKKLLDYIEYYKAHCQQGGEGTGATVKTDVKLKYEPFLVTEERPSIQLMKGVFEKLGIQMVVNAGGGGMDANRINPSGIECVGVATGYSKNHTLSETLVTEDLVRSGEMIAEMIRQFKA